MWSIWYKKLSKTCKSYLLIVTFLKKEANYLEIGNFNNSFNSTTSEVIRPQTAH